MTLCEPSQQPSGDASITLRVLSIAVFLTSVLSVVFVVVYVVGRAAQPEPTLAAGAARESLGAAQAFSGPAGAGSAARADPAAPDPSVIAHEALDPVGAGRVLAP